MILLDTHIFVEAVAGTATGAYLSELEQDDLCVSAISAAEIACLVRVGRLRLNSDPASWFEQAIERAFISVAPLKPGLLARAMMLEWDNRDPADRILLQTITDEPTYTLYTRDARITAYANEHSLRVRDCR